MDNISRNDIMHVVCYGAGLAVHCTLMSSIWLKHAERARARAKDSEGERDTESEGSDFYKHTTPPPLHVQGVTCFSGLPKKTKTILFWLAHRYKHMQAKKEELVHARDPIPNKRSSVPFTIQGLPWKYPGQKTPSHNQALVRYFESTLLLKTCPAICTQSFTAWMFLPWPRGLTASLSVNKRLQVNKWLSEGFVLPFRHIILNLVSLQCAMILLSSAECFQEKWDKHLLKVKIQTPPLLAVHSECVFVFSLGFWSSFTAEACAHACLYADVCVRQLRKEKNIFFHIM